MGSNLSSYRRFLIARIIGFVIVAECIALPMWREIVAPAQRATSSRQIEAAGDVTPPAAAPMDPLSQQLFGSRDVSFRYAIGQKNRCRAFEIFMFGRLLSPLDYTELVAAPSGSRIRVTADPISLRLRIFVDNALYDGHQIRSVFKYGANTEMENEQWFVRTEAPAGVATRVIGRQVFMTHRIGVSKIGVYGAGSYRDPYLNGYYTWPRLGFNVKLNAYKSQLEEDGFRDVADTNDLFGREGGPEWWKINGKGCYGRFDVDPKSVSSIVLKRYLKAKGAVPYEGAE